MVPIVSNDVTKTRRRDPTFNQSCFNMANGWKKWKIFLFVTVFLLFLSLFVNSLVTEKTSKRNSKVCKQLSCVYESISEALENVSEIHQKCPNFIWKAVHNETFIMYNEGNVDRTFLSEFYSYESYHKCHKNCDFIGIFKYYTKFITYQLQYAKARRLKELCGTFDEDYCKSWGFMITFRIYFGFFSIPATILVNSINLSTLRKMLGSSPGPALYLHFAEVITDGVLNIFTSIDCLMFPSSTDRWRKTCDFYRYFSLFQFQGVMKRLVSFLNQAYLTGLVADRLYALIKPFKYMGSNQQNLMRKRGKKVVLQILLGSVVFYFPFIIFRTFRPVFLDSEFWKNTLNPVDAGFSAFYSCMALLPVGIQIFCGILSQKRFKEFLKRRQETEAQIKKQERDKQLLLVGTIGLNIVTGIVNTISGLANTIAFYEIFGFNGKRPWWRNLVYIFDPVLTFCNGNGAVVIHVLFVKSYRKAFKKTWFGKLIWKPNYVQQVNQK